MREFGTILACMDGRIQRKASDYLGTVFGVRHMDTITTAGLVKHLAEKTSQTGFLLENLAVSVDRHGSSQIAVVAHHGCIGNPVPDRVQKQQVVAAISRLREIHPDAELVGLWLDQHGVLERVSLK